MPARRLLPGAAMVAAAWTLWSWSGLAGATSPVLTASVHGHPTHPVWYHDSTSMQAGSKVFLAWMGDRGAVKGRVFDRTTSSWATPATKLSSVTLDCGCTDSTGSNPNRHDVPALFADPARRVYALYGGGTASRTGTKTGPYFAYGTAPGNLPSPATEQRLPIPGGAFDLEALRDNLGTVHLVGQQGNNPAGAGSLLLLTFLPGTSTAPGVFATYGKNSGPYRVLVQGGRDASACAWQSVPGCNIYVIGGLARGPADKADPSKPAPLYLTWGWSEKSLSNSCGDPAGFCNRGLYFAESLDGGDTWTNARGTASVVLAFGPITYDDPAFRVVDPTKDVGLFKAVAASGPYPGTPWMVYQPGADQKAGSIRALSWQPAKGWSGTTVDSSRHWNNHLVLRATSSGHLYLWSDVAQSGSHADTLDQWFLSSSSGTWSKSELVVGANWFLTGTAVRGAEVLMWRGTTSAASSIVRVEMVSVS